MEYKVIYENGWKISGNPIFVCIAVTLIVNHNVEAMAFFDYWEEL